MQLEMVHPENHVKIPKTNENFAHETTPKNLPSKDAYRNHVLELESLESKKPVDAYEAVHGDEVLLYGKLCLVVDAADSHLEVAPLNETSGIFDLDHTFTWYKESGLVEEQLAA